MSRVSIGQRAVSVVLSSMLLLAGTLVPLVGSAIASSPSTTCSPSIDAPTTTAAPAPNATCWLDIRAPSSVRTGVPFQVQVAVTTDATKTVVATSDPCGSKAPIELDLGGAPYTHAPYFATANAGIATFTITIPFGSGGDYNLMAFGPPFGEGGPAAPASCANTYFVSDQGPCPEGCFGVGFMAVDIPLNAPIAPCPVDTECVQATSGGGTQATLIASAGSVWEPKPGFLTNPTYPYFSHVEPGVDQCGTTTPTEPNGVLGYTLTTTDPSGVIILAVDPRGKGVGLFNVCWTQTALFTPLGGGAQVTTGDLPNCKQRDQVAPCVIARTGGSGGSVAFLTVLATANDPDPRLYGH